MDSNRHLLSFVTNADGTVVSLHLDLAGVKLLIEELEVIQQQLEIDACPHSHLFSFPPNEPRLTETMLTDQPMETTPVQHVKIYGWNDEWAVRHGLRDSTDDSDGPQSQSNDEG